MIQSPDYHTDDSCQPEFSYPPIQVAEHRGAPLVSWSGLAIIRQLVERLGVAPAIDAAVRVLRRCKWYTESDHILTMIYNMLTGGSTLSDINRFRDDQGAKRLLGTERIPHATTVSAIRAVERQVARHQERAVGISHHHDALVLRLEVIDHAAQEFHAHVDLRLQGSQGTIAHAARPGGD